MSNVPTGGKTGQVLAKKSNTTYDLYWRDGNFLPLSGGVLTGDLDVRGHDLKNNVVITSANGNDYETYPLGFSYSQINSNNYQQNTGEDFPIAYATLLNVKQGSARFFQVLVRHHEYMDIAVRQYYQNAGGFQPWTRIATGPRLLWSGSWSSGTLTVSGFSKYKLFLVRFSENGMLFYATRNAGTFRGFGGYATSTTHHTLAMSHSCSGDVLTWINANRLSHGENSVHSSFYDGGSCTVIEIWGVC